MSNWNDRAWRAKLPSASFAWPERRLLPVLDADDVAKAVQYLAKIPAAMREAVRKRLHQLAKGLGVAVSDEQIAAPTFTADSATPAIMATFAADAAAGEDEAAWVARKLAEAEARVTPPGVYAARASALAFADRMNARRLRSKTG